MAMKKARIFENIIIQMPEPGSMFLQMGTEQSGQILWTWLDIDDVKELGEFLISVSNAMQQEINKRKG